MILDVVRRCAEDEDRLGVCPNNDESRNFVGDSPRGGIEAVVAAAEPAGNVDDRFLVGEVGRKERRILPYVSAASGKFPLIDDADDVDSSGRSARRALAREVEVVDVVEAVGRN